MRSFCTPEKLISILDRIREIQLEGDFHRQLHLVAETIVETGLFGRAVVSLFSPSMERVDVAWAGLSKEEEKKLLSQKPPSPELWRKILSPEYRIGHSYYIRHDSPLAKKLSGIESAREPKAYKSGWHPNDYLFIPLYGRSSKRPLGVLSVDDPLDKESPIIEILPLVELFAQEAAAIIEKSLLYKKLEEMEHYFKEIVEESTDIIVTTNDEGKVSFFNKGASEILGYKPDEIIGKSVVLLYENLESARRTMRKVRENNGRLRELETLARAKDGTLIPISLSVTMLYDKNGKFLGTAGIAKDLRELKRLQEREARGKIARILLRYINNYLMSINSIEWKLKEVLSEDIQKGVLKRRVLFLFERIKRNVSKISFITSKILESDTEELEKIEKEIKRVKITIPKVKLHEQAPYKGMKVLVADDEKDIRDGLQSFLRFLGFEVYNASNGEEAIEILKEYKPFDLIITDLRMPKRSGEELIKTALELNPEQPIIVITAFVYDASHCVIKTGLKNIFSKEKPFNFAHLENLIENALSKKIVSTKMKDLL